jgi:hypothetical protein
MRSAEVEAAYPGGRDDEPAAAGIERAWKGWGAEGAKVGGFTAASNVGGPDEEMVSVILYGGSSLRSRTRMRCPGTQSRCKPSAACL